MDSARRRALLGLCLFVAAALAGPAHFALVPHASGAQGELVHVCGGHGPGRAAAPPAACERPADPERGPELDGARHGPGAGCPLALLARADGAPPTARPALLRGATGRVVAPAPPRAPLLARTRHLLAPKQSPPVGA